MNSEWRDKTAEEIGTIFLNHWKWLDSQGKEGKRAILPQFDLREVDLGSANLRMANLEDSNLESANLKGASLTNAFRPSLQIKSF
jgi:uncharacterized protein YjbI with pentapeptide repeats